MHSYKICILRVLLETLDAPVVKGCRAQKVTQRLIRFSMRSDQYKSIQSFLYLIRSDRSTRPSRSSIRTRSSWRTRWKWFTRKNRPTRSSWSSWWGCTFTNYDIWYSRYQRYSWRSGVSFTWKWMADQTTTILIYCSLLTTLVILELLVCCAVQLPYVCCKHIYFR